MKTTTLLLALGATLSASVLVGCGSLDSADETAGSPSRAAGTAGSVSLTHDQQAQVAEMRMQRGLDSSGIVVPDGFIPEYAGKVCAGLRAGDSSQTVLMERIQEDLNYDIMEHAAMLGLAVGTHCPEYAARVAAEW